MTIATPSAMPVALATVRTGRRSAERRPSTAGSGTPTFAAHRATRLARLGWRAPDASALTVLCRTPRRADGTDPATTTAIAMAITAKARGHVIGGATGAPYRIGRSRPISGESRVPA